MMASTFVLVSQFLCLSVWIGGSVAVFAMTRSPLSALADNSVASETIRGAILDRFRPVHMTAMALLGVTVWIQLLMLGPVLALKLRFVLLLVSVALLAQTYERFAIARHRMKRRQTERRPEEDDLHSLTDLNDRSMRLLALNLFIGIAVVITLLIP